MSDPLDPLPRHDVLLVGGGLQSALIALALLERRPGVSIALVERGERLGGEHTWCFHADDVPERARAFVEPLVEHRWSGYDVCFAGHRRTLDCAYAGLSSAHLDRVVRARFAEAGGHTLLLGTEALEVDARGARLADGRRLSAELVLDARGPEAGPPSGSAGFQKFLGHELELRADHGLERPIVMDADVEQRDGFRFFYVLPLGPRRVLVEDTRFADSPELDRRRASAEIAAYAAAHGFDVARVVRSEEGVLPMPWVHRPRVSACQPFALGYRGGWMHPATGYSFPLAVRIAELVAEHPEEAGLATALRALERSLRGQLAFARLLNRLLFRWFLPERRSAVFERFYRLPTGAIRRFYALDSSVLDRVRILSGRPPRGFSLRARLSAARRAGASADQRVHVPAADPRSAP